MGNGCFELLLSFGVIYEVEVSCKIVDFIYMKVEVLLMMLFKYDVVEGVYFVLLNVLLCVSELVGCYVVLGVGKMGMDVVFFLWVWGVLVEKIIWVVSNDVWLFDCDMLIFG